MHHPMQGDDEVCVTNSIIVVRDPNPTTGESGNDRSNSVEGNYNLSCASSSGISSIRSSDNEAIRRKMCGANKPKIREKSWASSELIHGHKGMRQRCAPPALPVEAPCLPTFESHCLA